MCLIPEGGRERLRVQAERSDRSLASEVRPAIRLLLRTLDQSGARSEQTAAH